MTLPTNVPAPERQTWLAGGMAVALGIAAAKLVLHLLFASRYGFFGDELYHLACGEHLDWGYVDQPPIIALVAWLVRHTLGDSLLAVRFVPAVAGAALVLLAGWMARELGGGRLAVALSALSTACIGVFLVMHYLFTMNAFEPLFWMGCAAVLIRIIQTGNQKLWLWFGGLAGLGLQNKYSMGVFGFAVVVGLLLTPERRALAKPWIWLGGALALVIFLPNVLWNIRHDWPFLELMHNIRESGRDVTLGPLEYIGRQIFLIGPVQFVISVISTAYLLLATKTKPFRALGWAFVAALGFFIVAKGKDYYAAPAFPMVLAAGAVAIEGFTAERWRWLRTALVALLVVTTLIFLPIGLPVLSVDHLLAYLDALPFGVPVSEHGHAAARLPHHYAWQFGWEEMVEATVRVYNSLPPAEREKCAIFGNNFAEAGAIDLLGPKYGLPKAVGGHQSYWLWGPRQYTGECVIVLGDELEDASRHFERCTVAAELDNPYARPQERNPVLLCRKLKYDLREVWPQLKEWN